MDVTFICPQCHQELEADVSLAGTEIQCPTCENTISIPDPDVQNVRVMNPISASAAAREEKHFKVPQHQGPSEVLVTAPVKKVVKPADAPKQLRSKTIRRIDCVEVGHDNFDQVLSEFLQEVGESNLVSVTTIGYTYIDIGSQKLLNDYGVLVVYKG